MKSIVIGTAALAACALWPALCGATDQELLREVLRQQSAAQADGCAAVKRAVATEPNPALVVRTAVEIGYNACQVVRCAIEGGADLAKVIQGAGEAGVKADVAARCAVDAGADEAAVARVFADLIFEPSFCYYTFRPAGAPSPQAPLQPVIGGRGYQRQTQASPYTF